MVVRIQKPASYDKQFLSIGVDEWTAAFKDLTPAGFGLYLMLASNKANFHYGISLVNFKNMTGKEKHAYYDAKAELIEKGYIQKDDDRGDWFFTPLPKKPIFPVFSEVKKNGFIF